MIEGERMSTVDEMVESAIRILADRIVDGICERLSEKILSVSVSQPAIIENPSEPTIQKLELELSEAYLKIGYLMAVVGGDIYKGPMPTLPPGDICWRCIWFSGKICQRQGTPTLNKHVMPWNNACELYKHTDLPRGELIAKHGEGKTNHGGSRMDDYTSMADYTSDEVKRRRKGFKILQRHMQ